MHVQPIYHQRGATLAISLILLTIIMLLGTLFTHRTLIEELSARNEQDRQVAFAAAEAALVDAEEDIEGLGGKVARGDLFSHHSREGFRLGCGRGADNVYQGLCLPNKPNATPVWITSQLSRAGEDAASVVLGRFTGRVIPCCEGPFSAELPRYIIELIPDMRATQSTEKSYLYRVTAVGFGINRDTQVVLQSVYRKAHSFSF